MISLPRSLRTLREDSRAGLVLGVQSVPDGLATGLLAGLNPLSGLHAYIVGQPHRLRHLKRALRHIGRHRDDVWLTTPGAISQHCSGLPAGTVP